MTTKHILSATLLLLPATMMAQQTELSATVPTAQAKALQGEDAYHYDDALQLWRGTQNAAGLTIDSTRSRGFAEMRLQHRSGSYHRVQEGSQTNGLTFLTERYQHIGRYLYGYGRFEFDNGRTRNRAWSDVMRSYGSNPFISGSSVPGRYDFQNFDLQARVGTVALGAWRLGLGLDYKVGDLSRLRDPRSRSRLLDYQLTPSVSYTLGRTTLGVAAWYHRYKEKIPNITTVQNNPSLYYYQMSGLEAVTGTIGGYNGFSREYVNHEFGGELQLGYQTAGFRSVNSVAFGRGTEQVLEQYKRQPGRYYTYLYKLQSQNRIVTPAMIHQIDLSAAWQQAYADEYRPTLIITTDSVHGYTSQRYDNLLTYRKRYQLRGLDLETHYRLNFTDHQAEAVKSYVGVRAALSQLNQKHLLPESRFDVTTVDLGGEYGQSLLAHRRLWLTLGGGYHLASKASLSLADAATAYAQSVLVPDLGYYDANYWKAEASVTYHFPLTVKGYRSLWYVRAYGETVRAQHSMDRNTVGIAVGMFN